jgi:hypothetical protein
MALGRITPDPKTEAYLGQHNPAKSGFTGLYRLWYLFWSYRYLSGSTPDFLIKKLQEISPPIPRSTGTMEMASVLEQLCFYTILCTEVGIHIPPLLREEIHSEVLKWHHCEGGFGRSMPTLIETWHAVAIFQALNFDLCAEKIQSFLFGCLDDQTGFVNVPSSHPGYLEHLDAGVSLAILLNLPVPNPVICTDFICKCRKANGGFTRSGFGGNSTLEYTWYAIRTLSLLNGKNYWKW